MAQDPALLVYTQDILVGCAEMNNEEFGQYCRILFFEHQKGRMPEETIRLLVGSPFDKVKAKFQVDENRLWFNAKLEQVIEDRRKFVESRRNNGSKGGRPKKEETTRLTVGKPTEDENEIEDEDEKENINLNEARLRLGEFQHVCVSEKELELFRTKAGSKDLADDAIRRLDLYMENNVAKRGGKHYATLCGWPLDEARKNSGRTKQVDEARESTLKSQKRQRETADYIRHLREADEQKEFVRKRQLAQEALAREDAAVQH